MKVLLLHNEYAQPGGEEKVVELEARLLASRGHAAEVLRLKSADLSGPLATLRTAIDLPYGLADRARIMAKIREFRPEIVHVHNPFPRISPAIFETLRAEKIPSVFTVHNYRMMCANALLLRDGKPCELCVEGSSWNGVKYACYRGSRAASAAMVRSIAHHRNRGTWRLDVDRFISLGAFATERLVRFGVPADRISVKPNFLFDPLEGKAVPDRKPGKAVYVGRLSIEKGVRTLVNAWRSLGTDWELHIAGDGPLMGELRAMRETHPNLVLHGHLAAPELNRLRETASVSVLPSECYENFPLSLLEAMAQGLPVVAANIGGIPEIVGDAGFLFTPGDESSLATALDRAIHDPTAANAQGARGRARYLALYSPEANGAQIEQIYAKTRQNYERRFDRDAGRG